MRASMCSAAAIFCVQKPTSCQKVVFIFGCVYWFNGYYIQIGDVARRTFIPVITLRKLTLNHFLAISTEIHAVSYSSNFMTMSLKHQIINELLSFDKPIIPFETMVYWPFHAIFLWFHVDLTEICHKSENDEKFSGLSLSHSHSLPLTF